MLVTEHNALQPMRTCRHGQGSRCCSLRGHRGTCFTARLAPTVTVIVTNTAQQPWAAQPTDQVIKSNPAQKEGYTEVQLKR